MTSLRLNTQYTQYETAANLRQQSKIMKLDNYAEPRRFQVRRCIVAHFEMSCRSSLASVSLVRKGVEKQLQYYDSGHCARCIWLKHNSGTCNLNYDSPCGRIQLQAPPP